MNKSKIRMRDKALGEIRFSLNLQTSDAALKSSLSLTHTHTLACPLSPNVTQCSVPGREGGDGANERVIVLLRCRGDC